MDLARFLTESPPPGAVRRIRVRTLVFTRWIAIAGQVVTLLVVSEALQAQVPMAWAMAVVGCSAALNAWISLRRRLSGWHSERAAAFYLAYDILQLALLLYLTGGLQNPFALLFLVPVTISATVLSAGSTGALGLLTFVCISGLTHHYQPLPWPGGAFELPAIYRIGTWTALSLGMGFLMFYAWRVAEESRAMADALGETQLALAREQELSSVGSLAAAAAHELGTPLGTIVLVARELQRDLPPGSDIADDVALLNSEASRCREILGRLTRNPPGGAGQPFDRMPLDALVAALTDPYDSGAVAIRVEREAPDGDPPPVLRRSPEIRQALGNLIENAVEFARSVVIIRLRWGAGDVRIEIGDDGPGFPVQLIDFLGEPYVSTRRERGGMGLGVFISKTLLERSGATITFRNRQRARGAVVEIVWPRAIIDLRQSARQEVPTP